MIYNPTAAEQGGGIEWLPLTITSSSDAQPVTRALEPVVWTTVSYQISCDGYPSVVLFRISSDNPGTALPATHGYFYSILFRTNNTAQVGEYTIDYDNCNYFILNTPSQITATSVQGTMSINSLYDEDGIRYALIY